MGLTPGMLVASADGISGSKLLPLSKKSSKANTQVPGFFSGRGRNCRCGPLAPVAHCRCWVSTAFPRHDTPPQGYIPLNYRNTQLLELFLGFSGASQIFRAAQQETREPWAGSWPSLAQTNNASRWRGAQGHPGVLYGTAAGRGPCRSYCWAFSFHMPYVNFHCPPYTVSALPLSQSRRQIRRLDNRGGQVISDPLPRLPQKVGNFTVDTPVEKAGRASLLP